MHLNRLYSIHVFGFILATAALTLSCWSSYIDPTAIKHEVTLLVCLLIGMSLVYCLACYRILKNKTQCRFRHILLWAVLFRIVLLPSEPILETDWNRYLWDGFVMSSGLNPYKYAPASFTPDSTASAFELNDRLAIETITREIKLNDKVMQIHADINNPQVNTIYPPFTQLLFTFSGTLFPFSLIAWRCVIIFFDLVLIACIVVLLNHLKKPLSYTLVYAWSPLVLKEYINTTHFDVIALSLLFLAIVFYCSNFHHRSAFAWAGATMVKFFPALPFCFWIEKKNRWAVFTFLILIFLLTFPFLNGRPQSLSGLYTYSSYWESNSSLVVVFETLFEFTGVPQWGDGTVLFSFSVGNFTLDAFFLSKTFLAGFVILFTLFLRYRQYNDELSVEQQLRNTFWVVCAIILCSPVANPWYIAWVVPFLCFFPSPAWFYLTTFCFLYYAFFISADRSYPAGLRELEYIPFFLLLGYEWYRNRFKSTSNPLRAGGCE